MKAEAQQIAIAKACGWKDIQWNRHLKTQLLGNHPDKRNQCVPDYLNDLNAMHEAEKILNDKQQNHYAWLLVQAIDNHMTWKPEEFVTITIWEMSLTEVWFACQATAPQRAEAFLRTLNLWNSSTT